MGSRGRSIRLRIYFLVAIPLVTMFGLFGYIAYSSVTNWINLDQAPNLIRARSEPLTAFVTLLQTERREAVVYLSQPTAANLTAYRAAITATKHGELSFRATTHSSAATVDATPAETAAIEKMAADAAGMTSLRSSVIAKSLSPMDGFTAYTKIIADQHAVFQAEAASVTDTVAFGQGLGLIATVAAREDLSQQDALLSGALASHQLTGQVRAAFTQAAGRQHGDTTQFQTLLSAPELKVYDTTLNARVPVTMQDFLTRVQQGVAAGLPLTALEQQGLSPAAWQQATTTWRAASYKASTSAATATLSVDRQLSARAKERFWETAAAGVIGLILTLLVTIWLGRSINRRLTELRSSALALATEQLPSVVSRLRNGESVDVTAEAPPLRLSRDEIGQVGQAIDTVRQTAIKCAIEESRVRQGVNDMFRNLARRSQSLLQRQLALLDDMERRATDPDVLADLFKMDHLTTRMRRHAEGLIILSGAAPGRSWSDPISLLDVMRGAVAEVEDYARVTVATYSRAAVAGSAVTDVIHLLAELVENAATFSPPNTHIRVSGERVGNGFAIEIEDRGLGMSPRRLAELNERLANPPEINPASTEQLGLFVVGQLARRHRVSVILRPSPYGGTTAIALIPADLIVEESTTTVTTGSPNGASSGARATVPGHGADARDHTAPETPASPPIRIVGALRHPGTIPNDASAAGTTPGGTRRGRHSTGDVPVVTGVPVSRPAAPPASSFDVFTPIHRSGQDSADPPVPADISSGQSYSDFGGPVPGSSLADDSPATGTRRTGDSSGAGYSEQRRSSDGSDYHELPRRVRQANLAPQLRTSATKHANGSTGVPQATATSLSVMRDTLSAMQRGWQQGRSQAREYNEDGVNGE